MLWGCSVLNSASDRLTISSLLSYIFSGAFWSATCDIVRGRTLGIRQGWQLGLGWATQVASLWRCMSGRYLRGDNATCSALCQLSVTSPITHKQIGPSWCWFPGGWVCVQSRILGLSNKVSCESGSSSHCLNPHRFFQSKILRLYFPIPEPWLVWSVSCPSCSC